MGTSRKPDFRLKVLHKPTGASSVAGAAWENPDGSLSLVLDPGVSLNWRDREDCVLTLFPVNEQPAQAETALPPLPPPGTATQSPRKA